MRPGIDYQAEKGPRPQTADSSTTEIGMPRPVPETGATETDWSVLRALGPIGNTTADGAACRSWILPLRCMSVVTISVGGNQPMRRSCGGKAAFDVG